MRDGIRLTLGERVMKLKYKNALRRIAAMFTICCFITTNIALIPTLALADQIVVTG